MADKIQKKCLDDLIMVDTSNVLSRGFAMTVATVGITKY
jgi:hypothetical protein